MLAIGEPIELGVGTIVDFDIDNPGASVARLTVEIESRSGLGDVLIDIPDVNGVLTDVLVNPDNTLAPTAGWLFTLSDSAGNPIYASAAQDDADSSKDPDLTIPIAGTVRLQATGMGGGKRASITFMFWATN